MKKLINTVKLIALMFVGLNASGSIMIQNSDVVNSEIDSIRKNNSTKVVVRTEKGKIIHQKKVDNINFYLENLDMSFIPDGAYSLEFEKAFEIKITPFTVVYGQVVFDSENMHSIFKPVITTQGKLVLLRRLSFDKKVVKIKFFDLDNNLIYSEILGGKVELNRVYDFSERSDKNFKVVIYTDDKTFVQNIEL
ncbi:MAG: hypothetical protein KJO77_08725 [Bacteroidia bacterium]|nr:hypothetical protein [Bacteroidia bacterium]NND52807.1 hypothetical protein [Flavobacteriaceae bacterium]